jgi:hypothetical protein
MHCETALRSQKRSVPFELDTPLVGPVCSAFALELYLKCLIRLRRMPISNAHDLCELFQGLSKPQQKKVVAFFDGRSDTTREYIDREYEKEGREKPNFSFDFCLKASRNGFVRLRYLHEMGAEPESGWLGDVIMEGARSVILEKHPEWETVRQATLRGEPGFARAPKAVANFQCGSFGQRQKTGYAGRYRYRRTCIEKALMDKPAR